MKSVFFDLDGTLTDSAPGIIGCIRHALTQMGHVAPEAAQLGWCIGPPLTGSFATLLASQDPELAAQAVTHYRDRFGTIGYMENAVYDGALDAVCGVRRLGYRTFVVTSKPSVYAAKIVEHFGMDPLFERVYGSELSGERGEKGELIAHVLEREAIAPADAIMIGDRKHDVIGARQCGLNCIGAGYGYGGEAELRGNGAVAIAASPGDIPGLVQHHLG